MLVVTSGHNVTLMCRRPCDTAGNWIVWEKSANYTLHELNVDELQGSNTKTIDGVTFAVHEFIISSNSSCPPIYSTLNFVANTSLNGYIIKCGVHKPASAVYYPKEILILEIIPIISEEPSIGEFVLPNVLQCLCYNT